MELTKRLRIVFQLDWLIPTILFPHGVSGVSAQSLGLALILSSLIGDFTLLNSPIISVYCVAIFVNASSALLIVNRAPAQSQFIFRSASVLQVR